MVDGSTGEGDGIDSNGYLVINGGTVRAQACGFSADAGIDSDMGIHINGGLVMASGNMLDGIEEGGQNFAVFQFAQGAGAGVYTLKDKKENTVAEYTAENSFSYLILSGPDLKAGDHTLWQGDTRLQGMASEGFGMGPGMGFQPGQMPEGMDIPGGMDFPADMEMPEGMDIPGGMDFPEGMDIPGGMDFSEGMEMPEGMTPPEGMGKPGERPGGFGGGAGRQPEGAAEDTFTIQKGANYFAVYAAK